MKNICITGDSWGCGEWGRIDTKYQILHKGLEHYLKNDGFNVKNLSTGGSSNVRSYQRLKENVLNKFDLILFFYTDPCRDFDNTFHLFDQTLETYLQKANEAMLLNLHQLNQLNYPIYLIGGHSKINEDDVVNFKNLNVFIPSIIELLCPNFNHSYYSKTRWLDYIVENYSHDKQFIDFIYDNWKKQNLLFDTNDEKILYYFHPDGMHANRYAHYEIYKKVIELLN